MPKPLPKGVNHAFWSILDTASYPVFYMAMAPLLMRHMGPVIFGFWILLNTLITIFQMFNFNLGYTALISISSAHAKGQRSRISEIINALLKVTFLQVVFLSVIGGLTAYAVACLGWMGSYAATFRYGAICFMLVAILAGLKYFEQLFQNIIKAFELFKSAAILNMISRFGLLAVTGLVVVFYQPVMVIILLANVGFSFLYLIVHLAFIRRALPFYETHLKTGPGLMSELVGFSMWPWVQSILIILTFQADRLWVSAHSGLKVVAAYGLVATMFNHIHMIFMAMVAWVFPRIIRMNAQDKDTSAMYGQIQGLFTCITISLLLAFYFVSPWLFPLWIGADNYEQMKWFIRAFTAFEIIYVHTIMPFYVLNGTGHQKKATFFTLLYCGACYLFMMYGLYGMNSPVSMVEGMVLGICLAVPVLNYIIVKYYRQDGSIVKLLLQMLPVFLAILLIYVPNIYLVFLIILVIGLLLWRNHLSSFLNTALWRQLFQKTITPG